MLQYFFAGALDATVRVATAAIAVLMLSASVVQLGGGLAVLVVAAFLLISLFVPLPDSVSINQRQFWWIGGLILALFALHSVIWTTLFSSQQGSDFGVYYRCGLELRSSLADSIEACQSRYIVYGDLYWRRSLLYTVPVGLVGGDYFDLKIFNAILQSLSAAIMWFAVRAACGPVAAALSLLIYLLMPERIFALTLATPDNLAVLLILLGLAATSLLGRNLWLAGCGGAVVGMVAVGLDFSRSVGVFLILTSFVSAILEGARSRSISKALVFVAAVVLSYSLTRMGLSLIAGPGAGDGFLRLASSLQILNDEIRTSFNWVHHFWTAIPEGERFNVGLLRIVDEFLTNGAHYPMYVWEKAQVLVGGTGYKWFANADLTSNLDTYLSFPPNAPETLVPLSPIFAKCAVIGLLIGVIRGALLGRFSVLSLAAMLFFSVGCSIVLLIGEVQERYFLIMVPAASIVAGLGISKSSRFGVSDLKRCARGVAMLSLAAVIVCSSMLIARGWRTPLTMEIADSGSCDLDKPTAVEYANMIALTLPEGSECAWVDVRVSPGLMGVFATDGQFPLRFESASPKNLAFKLNAESASADNFRLSHVKWMRIEVGQGGVFRLELAREDRQSFKEEIVYLAYPTKL